MTIKKSWPGFNVIININNNENTSRVLYISINSFLNLFLILNYYIFLLQNQIINSHKSIFLNYFIFKGAGFFLLILFIVGYINVLSPFAIAAVQINMLRSSLGKDSFVHNQINPTQTKPTDFLTKNENSNYKIVIPKLQIDAPIVTDVSPSDEKEYRQKLMQGIAHAKGSYLPGGRGPSVLFAHSTDTVDRIQEYNAQFFALRELDLGDKIIVFVNNNPIFYSITDKKIISPDNIDILRDNNPRLILFTCDPPGTDWQRLVIFADLAS